MINYFANLSVINTLLFKIIKTWGSFTSASTFSFLTTNNDIKSLVTDSYSVSTVFVDFRPAFDQISFTGSTRTIVYRFGEKSATAFQMVEFYSI